MDGLVVRGHVVTSDGILENGWIAVRDGTISAVGQGSAPDANTVEDFVIAGSCPAPSTARPMREARSVFPASA
ncbi:hypothetical protein [Devosia aurantiaca]|uniref:hypothetical protein n=1 Tax=Devosia aurantiaca TaxID=2714858 RepID=UPI001F3CEB9C|nr:hypothetical protein [Devosia aurantiaca]